VEQADRGSGENSSDASLRLPRISSVRAIPTSGISSQWRCATSNEELQSAFLQRYSPDATIKSFLRPPAIITGGTAVSSAAGPDAPIYMKLFEPKFVMSSNEEPTLTAALAANTVLAVRSNGGQVTAIGGNDVQGYTFQYVDGRSTGTVTMTPVHAANEDYWPLRSGELVATVKVTIDETWVKSR
jgi:hypothetical protein